MNDTSDTSESETGRTAADDAGVSDHEPGTEPVEGGFTTELVEVLPNVVAVFGALPSELELFLEPMNSGLLSVFDHDQIDKALSVVGGSATVGGNLAQATASMQGVYRMKDESQALLRAGGTLASKDGAQLGTIVMPKGSEKALAQARFTPAAGLTAAQTAAAIGPALAMVALQSQLNQVTSLVQRNIDLTSQVIENSRRSERATLMSLVDTVDQALEDARAAGSVPRSLWETVASKKADLDAQRKKYRDNVDAYTSKIAGLGLQRRREYLQANASAVVFDSFALLATVKAWTGYQALAAAVAREAGATSPAEARHFDSIVANTRRGFDRDMVEAARLVESLTRELRIIVELPGPSTLKLSSKRKDAETARRIATNVLAAIEPLADALLPPRELMKVPDAACVSPGTDLDPYLRILRWTLKPSEQLRFLGLGHDSHAQGALATAVGVARERLASTLDKDLARLLVLVTDQHVYTADAREFLKSATFQHTVGMDEVRYVRSIPSRGGTEVNRIDLITRERNYEWEFGSEVDADGVDALAAMLAAAMKLPEPEREDLQRRRPSIDRPKGSVAELESDVASTESSEDALPNEEPAVMG